jgi:predicted MPP superfamily phosphohydrolase
VRLGRAGLRRVWRREEEPTPAFADALMGRRELLQKAGLFGAALPFGVSASSIPLSYDFRVETREIVLPNWPAALDGLRVVHLSDIHVGGAMDADRLQRVAELANGCEPDLVLHTGDFLTHRPGDFDKPLYEALAEIRAPYGQWGCLGNHDYENPTRFERRLQESGVTILRNRLTGIPIDGQTLEVGGLDFAFTRLNRAPTYAQSMRGWGSKHGSARILLNHDPGGFTSLPADCADLVLSGHTHGGHIGVQLTSSSALTLVGLIGIPDQGLFARGDMRMYVTRCVGFYGYPMRIGIPPEVALLILRSAEVVRRRPTDARAA